MYELRRDAKNATTEPISCGNPALGRCAGCPKCSAIASISRYGSLPSPPTDVAQPTNDSEAMLPGDTTLTRISSLASSSDKFLETLVNAALAAVYAGRMTLWRCVECAEKLTIRAHSAFRSSGRAARTQRTMPITPSSKAWLHCSMIAMRAPSSARQRADANPIPGHRRRQWPSHLSALDPWQIPGYPSLAARRITKPTIGITVAGGNGDTVALPQINRQLPVDSCPPDREAGTAGAVLNGMEVPGSG